MGRVRTDNKMLRTTSTVTPSAQCAQLQQDLSLLANVVDRLTTQNRKPSHVVLSEGERGLLEAHLHVLCHKLEKHSVAINSSRRQGGTLATGTRQRTKRIFTNRECHLCGTRFTSQWRTGPTGPSSLCNACGIRHARQVKQERARQSQPRKTSAVSTLDGVCSISPSPLPQLRASVHYLLN